MIKPMRHATSRRAIRPIVVALAVVSLAALTACAAPTSSSPVVTHQPVAHPSSPVHAQPTAPTPPGHLTCAALASLATVRAALGANDVVLLPFSEDQMQHPDVGELSVPQDGGLSCIWQNDGAQSTLTIDLIPNATGALATAAPTLAQSDDGRDSMHVPNVPVYGDRSWSHCLNVDVPTPTDCLFDIQVGNYWVEVYEKNYPLVGPYPPAPAVTALLNGIVTEVRGLPTTPVVWRPPTEPASFPTTCDAAVPVAALRTDFADSSLVLSPPDTSISDLDSPVGVANAATNSLYCLWSGSPNLVTFNLHPGSSWAWSAAAGPADAVAAGFTRIPGIGTSAWVNCTQVVDSTDPTEYACDMLVLVGHSWFELSAQASGLTQAEVVAAGRDVANSPGFAS